MRAVSCQAALQGVRVEVDAHRVCELADAAGQVGDRHLVAQGEDVGPVALGPPAGDVPRSGPAGGANPCSLRNGSTHVSTLGIRGPRAMPRTKR